MHRQKFARLCKDLKHHFVPWKTVGSHGWLGWITRREGGCILTLERTAKLVGIKWANPRLIHMDENGNRNRTKFTINLDVVDI